MNKDNHTKDALTTVFVNFTFVSDCHIGPFDECKVEAKNKDETLTFYVAFAPIRTYANRFWKGEKFFGHFSSSIVQMARCSCVMLLRRQETLD